MYVREFEKLVRIYENRKRKGTDDSDCLIVEKVWRIYWENQQHELGCKAVKWLLKRLDDKDANNLVKHSVYQHFYLNRNSIPPKHKKLFRKALKELPRKKLKKLKLNRK